MRTPTTKRMARASSAVLLIAAAMTAASCSATPQAPTQAPAQTPAQAPKGVEQIVEGRCFGCHPIAKALNWKAPNADAAGKLLDRMVGHGANLTAAERSTLIAYFVR